MQDGQIFSLVEKFNFGGDSNGRHWQMDLSEARSKKRDKEAEEKYSLAQFEIETQNTQ